MHKVIVIAALLAVAAPAAAETERLALAPLVTLGDDSPTKTTSAITRTIGKGLASLPDVELVGPKAVERAARKAGRRDLRACDGAPSCLAELGALVSATRIVYGEIGGLGDAHVVYLKVVDVDGGNEVRNTTVEVAGAGADDAAARAGAFRLLAPERYRGRLAVDADVRGATIYVNGAAAARSPADPVELPVGTHALRVTHPEFHDFVRFVDIPFDETVEIPVELRRYPIVSRDMRQHPAADPGPGPGDTVRTDRTPWHRRWYTIAGGAAVVFIGSAILVGALTDDIDADGQKTVDPVE